MHDRLGFGGSGAQKVQMTRSELSLDSLATIPILVVHEERSVLLVKEWQFDTEGSAVAVDNEFEYASRRFASTRVRYRWRK